MADLTGDSAVGLADQNAMQADWGGFGVGDLNRDGVVNDSDAALLNNDLRRCAC